MADRWDWRDDKVPRIDGKLAVVTGAASGLGAYIAEALCIKGASLVIADKDAEGAVSVAAGIRAGCQGIRNQARSV